MKNLVFLIFVLNAAFSQAQDTTLLIPIFPKGVDNNTYFVIPDTNYVLYKLPSSQLNKPKRWQEKDKSRSENHYGGGYFTKHYPDSMDLELALSYIDSAKQFYQVREAISWCIYNYEEAFPYLIARLSNKTRIGLENTADLIISGRISTGDMRFYGHGGMIMEDLFTVSGRVSAALNEITGEEFAVVHPDLTEQAALKFKQLWLDYLGKL